MSRASCLHKNNYPSDSCGFLGRIISKKGTFKNKNEQTRKIKKNSAKINELVECIKKWVNKKLIIL